MKKLFNCIVSAIVAVNTIVSAGVTAKAEKEDRKVINNVAELVETMIEKNKYASGAIIYDDGRIEVTYMIDSYGCIYCTIWNENNDALIMTM